jgi:aspartate-semialdehyde dehydrogenase
MVDKPGSARIGYHPHAMSRTLNVAVLGATGAVGREFLSLFEGREFPVNKLKLLASSRSAGKQIPFRGSDLTVEEIAPDSFEGIDVAFFSAGASRSKEFAPHAVRAGAVVIDNSSAFRMDPEVPLVVPEINFDAVLPGHKLIANPNCSAIIMLMAVAPLRKLGKIDRLVVSTYQSASGAGAAAMRELEEQTAAVLAGREAEPKVMPHVYAFNLFSHNTAINEHGYNDEEWKVIHESRKILSMPELRINVTCVRVPVLRAHSESVTIEFAGPAPSEDQVREVVRASPGLRLVDDRAHNVFPMPLAASGVDEVFVGRIRKDLSHPSAISLFVAGDQLLKGAALNAVQIAEKLIEVGRLSCRGSSAS